MSFIVLTQQFWLSKCCLFRRRHQHLPPAPLVLHRSVLLRAGRFSRVNLSLCSTLYSQKMWVQELRYSVLIAGVTESEATVHGCQHRRAPTLSLSRRCVKIAFFNSPLVLFSSANDGKRRVWTWPRAFPRRSARVQRTHVANGPSLGVRLEAWKTQEWRQCWKPTIDANSFSSKASISIYTCLLVCLRTYIYVMNIVSFFFEDSFLPDVWA